jgi:hypothetical protein
LNAVITRCTSTSLFLLSGCNGFYFGRFDIRTPSLDDFQAGQNFKIVELNGVTSEATSIYDPCNSLLQAPWKSAGEVPSEFVSRTAQKDTQGFARTASSYRLRFVQIRVTL